MCREAQVGNFTNALCAAIGGAGWGNGARYTDAGCCSVFSTMQINTENDKGQEERGRSIRAGKIIE